MTDNVVHLDAPRCPTCKRRLPFRSDDMSVALPPTFDGFEVLTIIIQVRCTCGQPLNLQTAKPEPKHPA